MRGTKRNPWLFGLGVLLAVLVVYGGHARADVTTDRSGSIIVFPKVVADGTRDTIIQIANTDNLQTNAHCIYTNAAGSCSVTMSRACNLDSECPTGEVCVHQCTETNFDIFLTAQQPTSWRVSVGRDSDPFGGLSPGRIGPVPIPFVGELKCVQVDSSGAQVAQNSLKGEATIFKVATGPSLGQVSQYNGLSILGNPAGLAAPSNTLNFNLTGTCAGGPNIGLACSSDTAAADCPGSTCTLTGEYNPCPSSLVVTHYAEGSTDSFTGARVNTELSLVPCTELIEEQLPTHALAQFQITTDMEQQLSASIPFDCYVNRRLTDISTQFDAVSVGSEFLKTRIRPATGNICYTGSARCHFCTSTAPPFNETDPACLGQPIGTLVGNCACNPADPAACPGATGIGTCSTSSKPCETDANCDPGETCSLSTTFGCLAWSGLLGVAEEFQLPTGPGAVAGTAAVNLFTEGSRPGDIIVLPLP